MEFYEQIQRMKKKLRHAKKADRELKVFGAKSHGYSVNSALSMEKVRAFEEKYEIKLTPDYVAFIKLFGNGGAGPFYGIYPLGENTNSFVDNPKESLKLPCGIHPRMSDEYWKEITDRFDDENMSDDEYDMCRNKMFGGLLPIGTQGCSYFHAIVLNGTNAGKVVNVDVDWQKPKFAFENNFLDWYERWLDEVISGDLVQNTPSWFGYTMGGDARELMEKFLKADDDTAKYECLSGISDKKYVDSSVIDAVEKACSENSGEIRNKLLSIMTKFDYPRAKSYLLKQIDTDLLNVCRFVLWHAKEHCKDWFDVISDKLPRINDDETFRFCSYILENGSCGRDYTRLVVPFAEHKDEKMRGYALYLLGKQEDKAKYVDLFIKGLHDCKGKVVHTTLQALSNVKDNSLVPHYLELSQILTNEPQYFDKEWYGYLVNNLNHRLKEYELPCI